MIEIKSILTATDFSEHSALAVQYASQLAHRLGSELHLLHVLTEIVPAGPDPLLMPVMPTEYYADSEAQARKSLETVLNPAWERPASVFTSVRWGSPVETLVSYATDHKISLIVIATHGRTGLSHAILGSVAEQIMREAPCPVLTIRTGLRADSEQTVAVGI